MSIYVHFILYQNIAWNFHLDSVAYPFMCILYQSNYMGTTLFCVKANDLHSSDWLWKEQESFPLSSVEFPFCAFTCESNPRIRKHARFSSSPSQECYEQESHLCKVCRTLISIVVENGLMCPHHTKTSNHLITI